jgi:hypothetical protein
MRNRAEGEQSRHPLRIGFSFRFGVSLRGNAHDSSSRDGDWQTESGFKWESERYASSQREEVE